MRNRRMAVTLLAVFTAVCLSACNPGIGTEKTVSEYTDFVLSVSVDSTASDPSSQDVRQELRADSDPSQAPSSEAEISVPAPAESEQSSGIVYPEPGGTDEERYIPDTSLSYCYAGLTERQKEMYEILYDAVIQMQSGWISLGPITADFRTDIALSAYALETDRPELFWIPFSYYSGIQTDADGISYAYIVFTKDEEPAYLVTRYEKSSMETELNNAVNEIKAQVTATDPYEIELQLHDLLCERITYSSDTDNPMVYTAYGALVKGDAVCEGYARAMQLLLREFGIRSTLATGFAAGVGHMWNTVELDGSWYHLDVTWDDALSDIISHEYFNLTDSEIVRDRTVNEDYSQIPMTELYSGTTPFNYKLPSCTSFGMDYFTKTGFVYRYGDDAGLADYIMASQSGVVEVRFESEEFKMLFDARKSAFMSSINRQLLARYSESGVTVVKAPVSVFTLFLYKDTY